jgi:hypothetical protein
VLGWVGSALMKSDGFCSGVIGWSHVAWVRVEVALAVVWDAFPTPNGDGGGG